MEKIAQFLIFARVHAIFTDGQISVIRDLPSCSVEASGELFLSSSDRRRAVTPRADDFRVRLEPVRSGEDG